MSSPNMRFQSAECSDWVSITLSTIADVIGGGTPSTSEESYWNGDVQWFTPSEITSKYVSSSIRTISEEGVRNSSAKPLPKGSILFTSRATLGLSAINCSDKIVTTNQGFQSIIPKDGWSSEFVYYLINQDSFLREVKKLATGSTFPEISPTTLKSIIVNVPESKNEQQKIAEFFTALDEKIRLNATKLSNIRSLKSNIARTVLFQHKGIQLNSWVEVQLSDVAEFIKTRDTFDSCIYVGTEHLNKDFGGLCKEVKDTASGVVFKENDILLSNIRPYLKKLWLSDCKGVCSADVLVIRSKSTILPSLLKHILSTEVFFDYVAKGYKGSKMPRGDKDHIELFDFMIPSDLEVQRKIADQLDLFEMMIFCLIKKNKHLELLKKAFMQRMFV